VRAFVCVCVCVCKNKTGTEVSRFVGATLLVSSGGPQGELRLIGADCAWDGREGARSSRANGAQTVHTERRMNRDGNTTWARRGRAVRSAEASLRGLGEFGRAWEGRPAGEAVVRDPSLQCSRVAVPLLAAGGEN